MSKSFEKEYKELAQSKLPDLWDRIEAGLSEKKPVSVPITINEEAINNETTIKKADSNKVLVFFRRYQTVAAALLCVIILVPAFLLMRQVGGGIGFSNSEEAKDAAPAEMMYAAAEEAPAEEAAATGAAEETAEEEIVAEDFAEEIVAAEENAVAEAPVAEKAMSDSEQVERSEAKESADVMLYRVTVEVIEKQEDSSLDISDGTLYLCAVIHNDESNGLEIGDEITVLVPQHLTEELLPGESYEIALTESDSRYYEYVVKSLNY
ncbi:MAG: hypothetical protein IJD96_09000 [Lachnospiraceae bacterium]|nr:hypothetical protein [Lachnospiraceae bacterium]